MTTEPQHPAPGGSTAVFFVNTYGGPDRWSWETLVSVGDSGEAVEKLADSVGTYDSQEAARLAGEQSLAVTLRDVVHAAVALLHGRFGG